MGVKVQCVRTSTCDRCQLEQVDASMPPIKRLDADVRHFDQHSPPFGWAMKSTALLCPACFASYEDAIKAAIAEFLGEGKV